MAVQRAMNTSAAWSGAQSGAQSGAVHHGRAHGAQGRADGQGVPGHKWVLREAGYLLPRCASSLRGVSSPLILGSGEVGTWH